VKRLAGATPRIETISPQFMCLVAEMVSKIRRRVLSERAFDIFQPERGPWACPKCSGPGVLPATKIHPPELPLTMMQPIYFDSHLTSKFRKPGSGIRNRNRGAAFGTTQTTTGDNHEET